MSNKFNVILADPPWRFEVWNQESGGGRSPEAHYPTMSHEDICNLPVKQFAAENCALFLWAIWPRIFDAKQVIESWGFDYRSLAWIWIKANRSGFGFFTGLGYYTRANSEPCLLAIRGSLPVATHDIQALIYSPVRAHSKKPDDQYRKIEALYPGADYLELFARRRRSGWAAWGNEVPSDIKMMVEAQ